ncbi:MAG: molybdopterin-guanine dinucleotide biosynthesis protein B [Actinobacteria bacterium]|nr:MAG: molybdopterin-guanine dinucleotide biosynthesis protein B [Actinomycetota bacterium]
MPIPVVSVVGKSDSGKTTFLEKLIPELKRRGHRVATVKHDVHGFDIDVPGKDTWRHGKAGADFVFISGPERMAMIRRQSRELALDEIAELADGADILLTEGYKKADKPKIEVSRKARSSELLSVPEELIAVVADQAFDLDVPQFGLDDAPGVADLIERMFLRREPVAGGHASACGKGD